MTESAKVEGNTTSIIRDSGKMQIAAGSATVLAVRPVTSKKENLT